MRMLWGFTGLLLLISMLSTKRRCFEGFLLEFNAKTFGKCFCSQTNITQIGEARFLRVDVQSKGKIKIIFFLLPRLFLFFPTYRPIQTHFGMATLSLLARAHDSIATFEVASSQDRQQEKLVDAFWYGNSVFALGLVLIMVL